MVWAESIHPASSTAQRRNRWAAAPSLTGGIPTGAFLRQVLIHAGVVVAVCPLLAWLIVVAPGWLDQHAVYGGDALIRRGRAQ